MRPRWVPGGSESWSCSAARRGCCGQPGPCGTPRAGRRAARQTGRVPGLFVYRPGALGDALLALLALRALREHAPRALITLASHPQAARLLQASGVVDRALSQDETELLWLFAAEPSPAHAVS